MGQPTWENQNDPENGAAEGSAGGVNGGSDIQAQLAELCELLLRPEPSAFDIDRVNELITELFAALSKKNPNFMLRWTASERDDMLWMDASYRTDDGVMRRRRIEFLLREGGEYTAGLVVRVANAAAYYGLTAYERSQRSSSQRTTAAGTGDESRTSDLTGREVNSIGRTPPPHQPDSDSE